MDFIDRKAQYCRYQNEIDQRMRQVLKHGHFIRGPEIVKLERILAAYVGATASGTGHVSTRICFP